MKKARLIFWCVVALLCLSILSNLPQDRYSNVVNGDEMTATSGITVGESQVIEEGSGVPAGLFTTTGAIPLQKGTYRVIFRCTTMAQGNVAAVHSAGSVNSDNTLGVTYASAELAWPGYGEYTFTVTLEQDVSDFEVQGIYGGDNAFMVHSVSIMSDGLFYTDTILLAFAILLFALWLDRALLRKPLALGEAIQDRFARFGPVFLVIGLGLLASYPLFNDGLTGGSEVWFHLGRMEGLTAAFADGQFPPRIDPTTLNHKGYAAGLMYPGLFLWPAALLRLAGLSYVGAYKLVYLAANFASAAFAYLAGSRMLHSRFAGAVTSVLYTFAQHRLFSAYLQNAQDEVLAMAVLPLFVWGLYEVCFGEPKKWPLLAAGATCLIQTHLATAGIEAGIGVLFLLGFLPHLLRNRGRLLSLAKSAGLTVLLNVWYLAPLLRMTLEDFSGGNGVAGSGSASVTDLFYDTAQGWFSPGVMLYLAAGALLAILLFTRGNEATARARRIGAACLVCGALLTVLASTLAPWLGFSRQFFAVCGIFFALCGGVAAFILRAENPTAKTAVVLLLTAACFLSTAGLMNASISGEEITQRTDPGVAHTRHAETVLGGKYLYGGADTGSLINKNQINSDGALTASDYIKDGTHVSFTYTAEGAGYIDIPLLYYPGYTITGGEGNRLSYTISPDTLIRVENPPQGGSIQTRYTGLWWWRVTDCISLAAALACIAWPLWKRAKRGKAAKPQPAAT